MDSISAFRVRNCLIILGVLFPQGLFPISHTQQVLMKFLLKILHDNSLLTDFKDDYPCPNNVPYSFPVVRAGITECSSYAVVSRLKSKMHHHSQWRNIRPPLLSSSHNHSTSKGCCNRNKAFFGTKGRLRPLIRSPSMW